MKLAHISDTHLGYYAYGRTVDGRLNQREVDVTEAFRRCLKDIEQRDPDLVVHSGDLFHVVRPSNYSLIAAYKLISNFQARRMGKPFVIIGGNHDTPQSAETTSILRLFEGIEGVSVETETARLIETSAANVLCVPHKSIAAKENVSWAAPPGPSVLVLHGLADAIAKQINAESFEFELGETRSSQWTYVALGDWHVHQSFGSNICYSGSTEFTSSDIWGEAPRRKGWVWFDSDAEALEFVPVETRPVIDLPVIDAADLRGAELGEKLAAAAQWHTETLPIVRQRVLNVTPELRREWPIGVVREIQQRALYYNAQQIAVGELARPLERERPVGEILETSWTKHVDAIPIPGGIDRKDLKKLGLDLLQEVFEREADPVEA